MWTDRVLCICSSVGGHHGIFFSPSSRGFLLLSLYFWAKTHPVALLTVGIHMCICLPAFFLSPISDCKLLRTGTASAPRPASGTLPRIVLGVESFTIAE